MKLQKAGEARYCSSLGSPRGWPSSCTQWGSLRNTEQEGTVLKASRCSLEPKPGVQRQETRRRGHTPWRVEA